MCCPPKTGISNYYGKYVFKINIKSVLELSPEMSFRRDLFFYSVFVAIVDLWCYRTVNSSLSYFQTLIWIGRVFTYWSLNNINTRKQKRCLPLTIGTFRCKNGDGNENVSEKGNSLFFKLRRNYSKSLTLWKCRGTLMELNP